MATVAPNEQRANEGDAQPKVGTPQDVDTMLTRYSIFLVLTVADTQEAAAKARGVLASIGDLVKDVNFRGLDAKFSCTVGIGARVWTSLVGGPMPAELHPFREVRGATHTAIATPGDLFFHIRAERVDMCVEFERLLLDAFGSSVAPADETMGFRYFDTRDLLGFVDGTANPVGPSLPESTLIGDEDPMFAGGSYVIIQKYLHPLEMWNALSTEEQEAIIGRTKFDNRELDDATGDAQKSHKTLSTIEVDGVELDILRDNMPFARPAAGEYGTFFIGYTRRLWVLEEMLKRMFIGDPPGKHDRILDFSTAVTGNTFFIPTAELLAGLEDDFPSGPEASDQSGTAEQDAPSTAPDGVAEANTSLGIGSLRVTTPAAPTSTTDFASNERTTP